MAVIPPVPDPDDRFFWDGVAEGRLLIQRCGDCGLIRHPPQPMCAACGSLALDTIEASGRGTVFTWMVSSPSDRLVVLVELEEGIRLVSNLLGVPKEDVRIGMPVVVDFVEHEGTWLPQFRPVG